VQDAIEQLCAGALTDKADKLIGDLGDTLDTYMSYCPPGTYKARPDRLLAYLFNHVTDDVEAFLRETGMTRSDLDAIMDRERPSTPVEAERMGRYFGAVADAFLP
jgi:hypothetical protein